jgi:putative addiction module component (TIGR02574 family)
MTHAGEQLLAEALRLSVGERDELIASLIESLEIEANTESDAAPSDEIARRLTEIDDGQVEMIDWSEAKRMLANVSA